ncbi:hypothetical protein [Clostridium folliculivorans]|uniref:Uncharacterized protein n=1 Tax=Clostridium folliculivorans TaxID=2886038 RepID=A0A9W5Y1W2_9CLOT|nr:hypothetical protein [Clostridium folliculivorans]GKU25075.1 hypothetical protein CFOLD11_19010 [Clostridium folliculivorans]GKU31173.1 hypothetical protein CFB3_32800 [Clostridium folliculivorans]
MKRNDSAKISKKKYIILSLVILILVLSPFLPKITYTVDSKLVSMDMRPIFAISKGMAKDGGTTEYRGLGYQVIRWNRYVAEGTEYGFEIYKAPNYRDLNDGPSKKLTIIKDINK